MKDQSQCKHSERHWRSINPKTIAKTAAMFAAVADPERLKNLLLLKQEGEVCVSELAHYEDANVKTVSARLKKLLDADIVRRRRDAKHMYYSLADEHVMAILYNALDHINHKK